MLLALFQLAMFTAKALIIVAMILIVMVAFFALVAKSRHKTTKGRLTVKNLNKKFSDFTETLMEETAPKKLFKKFQKDRKAEEKALAKSGEKARNVYVLNFHGDVRASAVGALAEEINAILSVATPADEVVLRLESAGGVVHGYGLAAAQLLRIRARKIPLTVTIDKVAASGGYMMACVADRILCAPFAIVGSIGVIVQMPNFNRAMKDRHIDFEMLTAGQYKRTLTVFGENTEEGRDKLQHEIEDIHQLFKNLIADNRQQVDLQKTATGEHWLGQQAIELKLVDELKTSDEYLLERSKIARVHEVSYEVRKPLLGRLTATASTLRNVFLGNFAK